MNYSAGLSGWVCYTRLIKLTGGVEKLGLVKRQRAISVSSSVSVYSNGLHLSFPMRLGVLPSDVY